MHKTRGPLGAFRHVHERRSRLDKSLRSLGRRKRSAGPVRHLRSAATTPLARGGRDRGGITTPSFAVIRRLSPIRARKGELTDAKVDEIVKRSPRCCLRRLSRFIPTPRKRAELAYTFTQRPITGTCRLQRLSWKRAQWLRQQSTPARRSQPWVTSEFGTPRDRFRSATTTRACNSRFTRTLRHLSQWRAAGR